MPTIGVVDTTFSRYDMGKVALDRINELLGNSAKIIRRTVPGIKDLPAACRILFDQGCDIVMAIGMPGPKPIDKTCAHEASMGLISLQIQLSKHIIECFVHEDEADNSEQLKEICYDRAYKHAENVVHLALNDYEWFIQRAGKGFRQGHPDAGPL